MRDNHVEEVHRFQYKNNNTTYKSRFDSEFLTFNGDMHIDFLAFRFRTKSIRRLFMERLSMLLSIFRFYLIFDVYLQVLFNF